MIYVHLSKTIVSWFGHPQFGLGRLKEMNVISAQAPIDNSGNFQRKCLGGGVKIVLGDSKH